MRYSNKLKSRNTWRIVGVLFIPYFIIQYGFLKQYDLSYSLDQWWFSIDILTNLVLILLFSAGISLLISLLPIIKLDFWSKIKFLIPTVMLVFQVLLLFSFGLLIYSGFTYPNMVKYEEVQVSSPIDCQKIKVGSFEIEGYSIERTDHWQYETDKQTLQTGKFGVRWVSSCEFHLIPTNTTMQLVKVKVTNVQPDLYECALTLGTGVRRYKVTRLNNGR